MLSTVIALAVALQAISSSPDTMPRGASGAAVAAALRDEAYLDAGAREMVRRARARSDWVDSTIVEYRMLAKERISVGVRALRRDRILFRRELAADILWRRDGTGWVRVLGARQVVPVAVPEPRVPGGASSEAAALAFDPSREFLLRGLSDRDDDDDDDLRHPLAHGSEAHYRFASGDTTHIRLPSGRELRLGELRVIPRRPEGLLLRGSFWLDLDTHSAVRGVFQLARPLDMTRDLDEDDHVPGILQPMEADLRYFTVEYGLWEDRWWLPRLISLEGEARVGNLLNVPVRFERSFEDFRVIGAGQPPLRLSAADTADIVPLAEDTARGRTHRSCDYGRRCGRDRRFSASDSALLASEHLPGSIYDEDALITEDELRQLADVLGAAVPGRSSWHGPVARLTYLRPELLRYNRVEGLAVGARLDGDFGPAWVDATLWLGTADLQPNAELGVRRDRFGTVQRVAAYRRLAAVDPDSRALGIGSSLSALVLGRDDSDYYRTLGAEAVGRPAARRALDYRWRVFVERQSGAQKETDLSLPRLFNAERTFQPNIAADPAEQLGAELGASYAWGSDPLGVRWVLGGSVLGATGDYRFARPSTIAFLGFPLPLRVVAAVELAGGTAVGDVPRQSLWHLGGPATVRGYGGGSRIAGDAFWRGRAEVATSFPAARIALFSDVGWAGPRGSVKLDPMLLSTGIGASFLDGLLRTDIARALRGDTGWRVDLYFDGIL